MISRPCAKIGHQTRRMAQGQRVHAGRKHGAMNVYRCDRCGLWHVGRRRPALPVRFKEEAHH